MKRFSKLLCFIVVFIAVMAAFCTVSFAATVGQPLTSPDNGWVRINDTDEKIVYENFTNKHGSQVGAYNNDLSYSTSSNGKISFKFKGTKFRIVTQNSQNRASTHTITIDGISQTYTEKAAYQTNMILSFEKVELTDAVHTIIITSGSNGTYPITLDAIDINDTGYLLDYYAPTNLKAIGDNTKVNLYWDPVEGATGYIVKRSETPGGPYTTTFSAITTTYPDTTVTNGATYYYVVTAIVNGVESGNSNEASATQIAPVVIGNSAILEITMVTGEIKEFDLTAAELQSFLTWYDGRSKGTDQAYYIMNGKNNIKPFLSRKEYIVYDKISSFEVKEYTE